MKERHKYANIEFSCTSLSNNSLIQQQILFSLSRIYVIFSIPEPKKRDFWSWLNNINNIVALFETSNISPSPVSVWVKYQHLTNSHVLYIYIKMLLNIHICIDIKIVKCKRLLKLKFSKSWMFSHYWSNYFS